MIKATIKATGFLKSERDGYWPWLFILPVLLGLTVFTYGPIAASFGLSFTYWNLLGKPAFVGFENYQAVMADPLFWKSFGVTWLFVLASTVAEVLLAVLIAVKLNQMAAGFLSRFQPLFRSAYFLPFITPMVSVSLVWGWLYEPQYGLFNWLLQSLHLIHAPVAWLYDPDTALWAVVILRVWKNMGYTVLIFLAALQGVPESILESADLDGASPFKRFFQVMLPMITPTMFFVVIVSMINAFQVFDAVYLLTQGGPDHSTELLVYWMFKNAFEFYKIGPASAIAYILFVVILLLTLLQWQMRKRWVLHEEDAA